MNAREPSLLKMAIMNHPETPSIFQVHQRTARENDILRRHLIYLSSELIKVRLQKVHIELKYKDLFRHYMSLKEEFDLRIKALVHPRVPIHAVRAHQDLFPQHAGQRMQVAQDCAAADGRDGGRHTCALRQVSDGRPGH